MFRIILAIALLPSCVALLCYSCKDANFPTDDRTQGWFGTDEDEYEVCGTTQPDDCNGWCLTYSDTIHTNGKFFYGCSDILDATPLGTFGLNTCPLNITLIKPLLVFIHDSGETLEVISNIGSCCTQEDQDACTPVVTTSPSTTKDAGSNEDGEDTGVDGTKDADSSEDGEETDVGGKDGNDVDPAGGEDTDQRSNANKISATFCCTFFAILYFLY
ncbi:uncharacterized protein [Amphiura filiformis]|uniref:uncharacterized protein n=1 Tax=Amphiura filiformis TaxID=82378 RepID=UPI003B21517B